MSALDQLLATPFASGGGGTPAPATPVASLPAPTTPALKTLTAAPYKPTATPPPALSSLTKSPYKPFEGYEPSGAFVGKSDQSDPYSNRPFFAYKLPGQATTTDTTRTAPGMNPEVAAPTQKSNFENPRLPESASQTYRKVMGATRDEELDHRMALAVGGSNDTSNLKPIPTADNQAASKLEGKLPSQIAAGEKSLFAAQNEEAKAKGLPAPWTDQDVKRSDFLSGIKDAPDNSVLGTLRNTILGLPRAAGQVFGDIVGSPSVENKTGLDNLNALSAKVDSLISTLGTKGSAIQKEKDALDATPVDKTNPASVNAYNQKVNAFNDSIKKYNFGSDAAQKIVQQYTDAAQSYASSVSSGGGIIGLAQSIIGNYVNPSPVEQDLESQVPGILNPIEAPILRTIVPVLEPYMNDVVASVVFNNSELYKATLDHIQQSGGLDAFTAPVVGATQKTWQQILGDTTQAVVGAYMPEVFGEGLAAFGEKGIGQAILSTAMHGATAGAVFGSAQAASSGSTDPREIAATILQNVIAGALLSTVTAGVMHGLIKGTGAVTAAVVPRIRELQAQGRLPDFRKNPGGFIKLPGGEEAPKPKEKEADVVYRASDEPFDPTKAGPAGTFVSPSENISGFFGEEGKRNVEQLHISPDAKVLEWKDIPDELKNFDGKDIEEAQTKIAAYARENGYDVVNYEPKTDYPTGIERQVVNPSVLDKPGSFAKSPTEEKTGVTLHVGKEAVRAAPPDKVIDNKPQRRSGTKQDFIDTLERSKEQGVSLSTFLRRANDVYDAHHPATRDALVSVYQRLFEDGQKPTAGEIQAELNKFDENEKAAAQQRQYIQGVKGRLEGQPQYHKDYLRGVIQRRADRADVRQTIDPKELPQGKADMGTQINGLAEAYHGDITKGSFKGWSTEARDWYQRLVRERRNTPIEARVRLKQFKEEVGDKAYQELLDAGLQGMHDYDGVPLKQDGHLVFKDGEQQFKVPPKRDGAYGVVARIYKELFDEEVEAGIPVHEKQNYEPIYLATAEEKKTTVPGRIVGLRPKFTVSRDFDSYSEAINAGKTPAFENLIENLNQRLMAHYHAMADAHMFNDGIKTGYILPDTAIDTRKLAEEMPGTMLTSYDPDRFPKKQAAYGNTVYRKGFMGPKPIVDKINNYLRDPDGAFETFLATTANIASAGRSLALGLGIPKTAFTVHYWNLLRRDASIGGLRGVRTQFWWALLPNEAAKFVDSHLGEAMPLYRHGLVFSTEDMNKRELDLEPGVMAKVLPGMRKAADWWHKQFSGNFYGSYLPARQMQSGLALAKQYLAQGMSEDAAYSRAATEVNDMYGIMDREALGKQKAFTNFLRTLWLAPQLLLDNLKVGGKMVKGIAADFKPGPNEYRVYANYAYLLLTTYAALQFANYERTGHYSWDNDPLHAGDLDTGLTDSVGRKIYVPMFGSGDEMARIPMQAFSAIAQGKYQDLEAIVRDRLSTVSGPAVSLVANVDWSGNPLYGSDKFGHPIPANQAMLNIFNNSWIGANLPGQVNPLTNFIAGKESGLQLGANELGLPVAFKKPSDYSDAVNQAYVTGQEEKAAIKPIYDQVQSLVAAGNKDAAQKLVDGLTDAQYKTYKSYSTTQKSAATTAAEKKFFPTYQKIQGFVTSDTQAAQRMVDGLSDADYKTYTLLKSKLKAK